MPSNTPSPYRRPWSNTETTASLRSYHVPSIHTMEGIGGICLLGAPVTTGGRRLDEAAGDRTQDLRIKSPLLYQLSYPLPINRQNEGGEGLKTRRGRQAVTPSRPSPRHHEPLL